VPAQHLRAVASRLAPYRAAAATLVICAKGIELGSGKLMSDVLGETCPGAPLAVLSGPTFAAEVAAGKPTAVTLACDDTTRGRALVEALGSTTFRPYVSDDVIGAQVGGAIKNVIAIACGIVEGRKLGDNARAALITRGLAEILRLAAAKGGEARTLMGLAGLGDLTLTCNAVQSRNFSLGVALGRDRPLAAIMAERTTVAEGVFSASSVMALARRLGVEMPICAAVDAVLNHGADLDSAIARLLARPVGAEAD
jgi:glycerol-3-phosphate dehydrogenase (NAD(P)+)